MKSKKRQSNARRQISEAVKYLADSKNYLIAVAMIFIAGIFGGIVFSSELGFLDEILKELLGKIEGMDTWGIISFILANNLKSTFIVLILGLFLGIFPIINALSNGMILGYVSQAVVSESGIHELWRVLPHGIFEIPAIFISLALGLKLGMFIFSREKLKELLFRAKNSMIIFVLLVIPLLILAAVIEGLLIAAYK